MNAKEIEEAIRELQLVIFGTPESPTPAGLKRKKVKVTEAEAQVAEIVAEEAPPKPEPRHRR